jgi:hypothetical protein
MTQSKAPTESKPLGGLLAMLSDTELEWLYIYLNSAPQGKRMERASWLLARYHLPRSTAHLMKFLEEVESIRMGPV